MRVYGTRARAAYGLYPNAANVLAIIPSDELARYTWAQPEQVAAWQSGLLIPPRKAITQLGCYLPRFLTPLRQGIKRDFQSHPLKYDGQVHLPYFADRLYQHTGDPDEGLPDGCPVTLPTLRKYLNGVSIPTPATLAMLTAWTGDPALTLAYHATVAHMVSLPDPDHQRRASLITEASTTQLIPLSYALAAVLPLGTPTVRVEAP